MPSGTLQVNDDGTLRLTPQPAQDTGGLEDALSQFADRTNPSETPPRYRLSAASVWRARRMGLSLETIIQTLETHSGRELPDKLYSELTLWSQQIDRLWLEVDQGRLVLRSANPLVITAVVRHRTLRDVVSEQLDATTAALRAEAYPELIATFDACRYPVLDHVPSDWTPEAASPVSVPRRWPTPPRTAAIPRVKRRSRRSAAARRDPTSSLRCQALTQRGRRCQNRVRPPARYCRVHADRGDPAVEIDADALSLLSLPAYLAAFQDGVALRHEQMARSRISVLMGVSLGAWLLHHLLTAGLRHGLGWSPAPWLVSGVALGLSCGVLGRLVAGMGGAQSLGFVGLNLLSIGLDCLHKEGLILHLCFVGIPVLLPLWGLSWVGLSWAWVFLCFPVGLLVGQLLYAFLDAMSG
jgi:Helicase conserved C-terminal domain